MSKRKFKQENKKTIDSFLLNHPDVKPGKMFGYPAYYVDGKLFACLYEEGVGIKIPEKLAIGIIESDDIIHFQPMGRRKVREWVQINRKKSEEFLQDQEIFKTSIKFVQSLVKSGK